MVADTTEAYDLRVIKGLNQSEEAILLTTVDVGIKE
jgi:hypothetical protein